MVVLKGVGGRERDGTTDRAAEGHRGKLLLFTNGDVAGGERRAALTRTGQWKETQRNGHSVPSACTKYDFLLRMSIGPTVAFPALEIRASKPTCPSPDSEQACCGYTALSFPLLPR